MAPVGIGNSFIAAIQASLSVLLVIFYGAVAARYKLLDASSSKSISKISVKIFLPALLLTKIGSELQAGSAGRYAIILLWAVFCHFVSFSIGIAAHLVLGMPDWITAAIMFNNTTSYPLLLIQSLDETGILTSLITTDETTKQAIERAKSYFLVFATVSSCLTFAVGPRLMEGEHAPEPDEDKEDSEEYDGEERNDATEASEQTPLFLPQLNFHRGSAVFFPSKPREASTQTAIFDRRPLLVAKRKWNHLGERTKWWLLFLYDFFNAPLLGAILGAIVGLIPVLHKAFFADTQDGGIFTAWLTASLKNVGNLFVPLPVVVAGVSLYLSVKRAKDENLSGGTPWLTTVFILVIRFVIWPLLSIGIIYVLVKNTTILGTDPMLWFAMMLMPTGPPAMKLITMVEVSDAGDEDEHRIAKLLTISYVISPVLAFTVVGALHVSQSAISP